MVWGSSGFLDEQMALTLTPAEQLSPSQKQRILQISFSAQPRTQIFPYAPYQALYEQRQTLGIQGCLTKWEPQQYRDLLAWENLIRFDPLTVSQDAELQRWLFQSQAFTSADCQRIISKQRTVMSQLLPAYHALLKAEQTEISACAYHHPLLPLLSDSHRARAAHPEQTWPDPLFCWTEDGDRQLLLGKQAYRHWFRREPHGVWPPALALSEKVIQSFAQLGFQWFCGDESFLEQGRQHPLFRDPQGQLLTPEWLYRPYRIPTSEGDIVGIFRDRYLSDRIHHHYSQLAPATAAQHLLEHLLVIGDRLQQRQAAGEIEQEAPGLVTITLSAAEGWEHYDQLGFKFLSELFERGRQFSNQGRLRWTTISDYLQQFPSPTMLIPPDLTLSTAQGKSMKTWIGSTMKNRAWDCLIDARQTLANHPEATEHNNPDVWQSLYAAENSDWFAAIGSPHSQIDEAQFRAHLIRVYRALNESVPGELQKPLGGVETNSPALTGCLYPRLDDLSDLTPWQVATIRSVPKACKADVTNIYTGRNTQSLYLRLDFRHPLTTLTADEFHFWWYYPHVPHASATAAIANLPDQAPLNYYFHHHCWINWQQELAFHETAGSALVWQRSPFVPNVYQTETILVVELSLVALARPPQTPLNMMAILAKQGEYMAPLSGNQLWHWD